MRSALICVFFTLVVHKGGSRAENDEDFRPTPIPLVDWPSERQQAAGTLHEIIKTEAPPAVAAVPAHYWEDALRHSVYLTLVRDKIDQLIAKGAVISPDSKPDSNLSKEIDDHDLWEKIKTARFDRLKEEPIPPGDVTILARGRLLEDKDGFRFAEDDATRKNCSDSDCTKGVKAYWSVKRVRQGEIVPGKYHYELTFAVTSQTNRKLKKPYENPVRTFTIKENTPTERPQARHNEPVHNYHHNDRYNRATWIHKNINPVVSKRPAYARGLDRIFTSLFSDDDGYEEPSFRQKQKPYVPQMYPQQHSKVGYVDDRDPYHQKKLIPYPLPKPQAFRYNHPPIPPPPVSYIQNPYLSLDSTGNTHYVPQYQENRYVPPLPPHVKTTRPAVLPTPIGNYPLLKESTVEVPIKTKLNATEHTTKEPEVTTIHRTYIPPHHSQKPPMKVSYFPENIRPPVYNAPPGVFVTMDKKPFKPMPPLKLVNSNKPQKAVPSDFRPSPQVLDTQFSDPDSIADTAFRPITMNFTEMSNTKKLKKDNKNIRTPISAKKPPKKHEFIKSHRLTTVTPDIITAHSSSEEVDTSMEWTNLLGAFTKTTPMASEREKDKNSSENNEVASTSPSVTTTDDSYDDIEFAAATTTKSTSTTTTTTTPKPKKRTRPPPKFTKLEKLKKTKRVTTSTSSTTTTSTTVKPTRKLFTKKPSDDLTPQASSAATSGLNSVSQTPKEVNVTSTTSTTERPTTTKSTTAATTLSTSTTTVETEHPVATTQPKNKNRFRQSTLILKGTSVKHDRWSGNASEKNRTIPLTSSNNLRRKASKFQGYVPSSTRSPDVERNNAIHKDHAFNSQKEHMNNTEQNTSTVKSTETTQSVFDALNELHEEEDMDSGEVDEIYGKENENDIKEPKDDNEYIFPTATTLHEVTSDHKSIKQSTTTEINLVASPHSTGQNKTKCKKKKHANLTNIETALESVNEPEPTSSSTTTTESAVSSDIFNDLFGGFTMDDTTEKSEPQQSTSPSEPNLSESEKHERYVNIDDDLEDFLHSLDPKSNHFSKDDKNEEEEYEEDERDEDSPFNNDDDNFDSRQNDEYYDESQETHDRPLSLLELMAME